MVLSSDDRRGRAAGQPGSSQHVDVPPKARQRLQHLTPRPPAWRYETRTFEALGYRFSIRSTWEGVGRYLDAAFEGCGTLDDVEPPLEQGEGSRPVVRYSLLHGLPGPRSHAVYVGDELGVAAIDAAYVFGYLIWHINQQVIARGSKDHVLLHAAGAVRNGVGVILPAGQEAGKTTLVAGLVRAGFGYLSDEAVAVRRDRLDLLPFAKPLSIDPGSWSVLAELRPRLDPATAAYLANQWQVPAHHVRRDAFAGTVTCRVIVFPSYVAGAATRLEPLRGAESLTTLLSHCFHFHERGARNFEVLARLAARSRSFRLTSGDLAGACEAVMAAMDADPLRPRHEGRG